MDFTFATADRIILGSGSLAQLPDLVAELGRTVLLVGGSDPTRHLGDVALNVVAQVSVSGEPTFDDARAAVAAAREAHADVVVAIGGGAVIDLAKATACLAQQDGDPIDYAEVIGSGRALAPTSLPLIAVPTTAGTGSEVTGNAVLASPEHQVKVSLRSPAMLPRVALIDPALATTCPPEVSANAGMDALTQCIEPYVSRLANPLTDAIALKGFSLAAGSLVRSLSHPDDLEHRELMATAALCGGLALANAKLGAVHGLAAPIGGLTGAPHGAICAALLAEVTSVNITAMLDREPTNPAIERYRDLADATGNGRHLTALQEWLRTLNRHLESPGLAELGLEEADHDRVATAASRASSMQGNPIQLTHAEVLACLAAAA